MSDINVQELATKVVEELKKSPEKLKTFAANNEVLKGILGDDGKLTKEDFDRIAAEVKKNDVVKGLLGEDGKLGLDDLQNVANAAKAAGEGLLDKAKDLFSK
jgi:hypothetical protein